VDCVQNGWVETLNAKRTIRMALYVRVSTDGQSVANQERELREVAEAKGWEVTDVYRDHEISGAKGRDKRPELDRMLKDATRRKFDVLAAWSVDRLGRSLQDLLATLNELHGAGCNLYLHKQALDTRTPSGRAMFGMLGVFAEFEREMIRERVNAGLRRAVQQGKSLGRPRLDAEVEKRVLSLRARGKGIHAIRRELGIGASAVQRILAQ
jgi:DNA invertase Pin-like site-specific DNA recombinase